MAILKYLIYPLTIGAALVALLAGQAYGVDRWVVVAAVMTAAILWIAALERFMPYQEDWNLSKRDLSSDIIHNSVALTINIATMSVYALVAPMLVVAPTLWPTGWLFWQQLLLALLIFDFCHYVIHRASHNVAFLWRLHAVHHAAKRLYWLNGNRRHPLHHAIEGGGLAVLLLLGVPAQIWMTLLTLYTIHLILTHVNIDYKTGPLKYVFLTSEVHRWHHEKGYSRNKVNFGGFLSIWDLAFRTFHIGEGRLDSDKIGIKESPNFPTAYVEQLKYPFLAPEGAETVSATAS
jgi:sterol desaturase/sphingolipid hydroxylase (fatty acid hydroxylase superfamily)